MRRKTNHNILLCAAVKGSLWTRLSFAVMGAGCIRYKQYARGLMYLLIQVGFIFFFNHFALQYLSKFSTLGTEAQRKVWNEELQIFQRFPGDNSMLILLYSVLSLAVIVVFLYIWYANVRDSWYAQKSLEQGRKIDNFRPPGSSMPCPPAAGPRPIWSWWDFPHPVPPWTSLKAAKCWTSAPRSGSSWAVSWRRAPLLSPPL